VPENVPLAQSFLRARTLSRCFDTSIASRFNRRQQFDPKILPRQGESALNLHYFAR